MFHQQAADEIGGNTLLGGAGEEGLGKLLCGLKCHSSRVKKSSNGRFAAT